MKINAMTVDVEDYFHVSAFEPYIPKDHWDILPHRVEHNTHKILDLFDRKNTIVDPNNNYLPPNYLKVYCFIHSCNLPETGTKMLNYLLMQIKHLPFEKIFINNIGIPIINKADNIILTNYSTDINLFEIPTINKMNR